MADDDDAANETADMKLDAELWKLLEENAECDDDSAALNDKRRRLREKAEKLGVNSHDFREQVYQMKKRTKAERAESARVAKRFQRIWDNRQGDLWSDELRKTEERTKRKAEKEAKAKAKAAEAKAKSIEAGDDNPRSDPKRGGAGKKPTKAAKDAAAAAERAAATSAKRNGGRPTDDELSAAAANAAAEQAEGGALLDTTPKSQSQIERETRDKLGL